MAEQLPPVHSVGRGFRGSLTLKLILIGVLIFGLLLLTIPLFVIIDDRQDRQDEVVEEISSKWGGDQTILGPILSVPYRIPINVKSNGKQHTTHKIEFLHFLPENLEINASVKPEMKYRGIFETVVYRSVIQIKGNFAPLDWSQAQVDEAIILKELGSLSVGIPDVRGIREKNKILLSGKELLPLPGLRSQDLLKSGIHAKVSLVDENQSLEFSIELHLDGSSSLAFSPLGKTTSVSVKSTWPSPSFDGAFLPLSKKIDSDGFSATWKVLHLNRPIPLAWAGSIPASSGGNFNQRNNYKQSQSYTGFAGPSNELGNYSFGVKFYLPTDVYQKTTRMAKYAILFLVFGFMSFFFTEILQRAQVHPIQYLLVGFAILIFYLLLLSLSEHLGFDLAYLISTAGVVVLICTYASAILRSSRLAISVCLVLSILYGYLYVILQLESYALLMGSLGLFASLALAMYFTRKIDWYSLRLSGKNQ